MSRTFMFGTIARLVLTYVLLIVVGKHAHWSVAVSLWLLFCSHELQGVLWRKLAKSR